MSTVTLVEYQDSWPADFQTISHELAGVFSGIPVEIEHIGSTAVPQLCAKPVIDVLLGVADLSLVEARIKDLSELGYEYRAEYERELPFRRYFVRPPGVGPRVHLHATVLGASLWTRHMAFREALRTSPDVRAQYAVLKRELAARYCDDKSAYTAAKAPFILAVLADRGV